jgi:hypothetical protein
LPHYFGGVIGSDAYVTSVTATLGRGGVKVKYR